MRVAHSVTNVTITELQKVKQYQNSKSIGISYVHYSVVVSTTTEKAADFKQTFLTGVTMNRLQLI